MTDPTEPTLLPITSRPGTEGRSGQPDGQRAGRIHLVLLGLMGAGKSTVGHRLAGQMMRPLLDSDDLVHLHYGVGPADLERVRGVEVLHAAERDVACRALRHPVAVVFAAASCVVEELHEMDLHRACTVWLDAPPEVLEGRVRGGRPRPVLGENPLETLRAQYEGSRRRAARCADVWVDTAGLDVEETCRRVIEGWRTHCAAGSPER